jgi:hypothetical protein
MSLSNRWVQLLAGIMGMVAVATFQYSWTLFGLPLRDRHGWKELTVQYALYLFFVPAQTWLVPLEGYLAERFGPRRLLIGSGALPAWAGSSMPARPPWKCFMRLRCWRAVAPGSSTASA